MTAIRFSLAIHEAGHVVAAYQLTTLPTFEFIKR